MTPIHRVLLALLCGGALQAQITQIDLRLQSKDVDFSAANLTKPFKSGTGFPSTCSVGEMFYKLDASAGANLYACTALNSWTLEQGSGGGGASSASQLSDFAVTRTSATTLGIGANCSVSTPCQVRFGSLVYSFGSGATVTISAGSGLAFVYVSSSGALTVGHNVTASCNTGCVAQSGVTAFPGDAIPLFSWSATGGAWDVNGGADQRAFLSSKAVTAGAGLTTAEVSGKTQLSADPAVIGMRTAAPSTSGSACTVGSWALDASFFYVCIGANSWRRAALSSF
jgi:hypothetical protein